MRKRQPRSIARARHDIKGVSWRAKARQSPPKGTVMTARDCRGNTKRETLFSASLFLCVFHAIFCFFSAVAHKGDEFDREDVARGDKALVFEQYVLDAYGQDHALLCDEVAGNIVIDLDGAADVVGQKLLPRAAIGRLVEIESGLRDIDTFIHKKYLRIVGISYARRAQIMPFLSAVWLATRHIVWYNDIR